MLTENDVYEFIRSKMEKRLSARYVTDIIVLLKSIYRYAARVYGINNCLEGVVMPKNAKTEIKVLSNSELAILIEYLNDNFDLNALGIVLSQHIGIRIGELCALQWKDIDLKNRTITIRKTIQRINCYGSKDKTKIIITEPKSQSLYVLSLSLNA